MTPAAAEVDLRHRPPAMGRTGMVASSQGLASMAGIEILREGGSAVDAALAANAVLAVTEPHMCGPGGDLFAMVWDPDSGRLQGLNASGAAPLALSLDALRAAVGGAGQIPARGPLTLTAPGAVRGWQALHERYGRLPWSRLFERAIAIAEDGFAVGMRVSLWWQHAREAMLEEPVLAPCRDDYVRVFLNDGRAPDPGETHRNPALGRLFRTLGSEGAEVFYRGPLAQALAASARGAGGHLALEDLESVRAEWVSPLAVRYRGHEVHALPPNGQGLCLLQMLALLETFPPVSDPEDPRWWHRYLEAKKLAFADRARYYADPAWAEVPGEGLLAPDYTRARAALIDPSRASVEQQPGRPVPVASDTTYLCAADDRGQMVSLIQSLFLPFGSGIVVAPFGYALQSRGSGFSLQAGHPNVHAPGKRPFHTIMPGFVTRDGQPRLALGAIGGDMQPQAQAQVLARILEFGDDIQRAGARPRMRHHGGASPNGEILPVPGVVEHESGFSPALLAALIAKGHVLGPQQHPVLGFAGGYQAIMRDPAHGSYWGASDPRLDGCALGV